MASWKITKKLKETHLGSWSSNSSRNTTNATPEKEQDERPESYTSAEDEKITAEALTQAPVIKTSKPGILIVTLHEGRGFSLPEQYRHIFASHSRSTSQAGSVSGSVRPGASNSRPQTSSSGLSDIPTNHGRVSGKYMPYALLDFDKVQVFVNSIDGSPENPTWAGSNTQYKFDVSRVTQLTVHLYIRNPSAPPNQEEAKTSSSVLFALILTSTNPTRIPSGSICSTERVSSRFLSNMLSHRPPSLESKTSNSLRSSERGVLERLCKCGRRIPTVSMP
uniref:Uncharacterized protein n=1 Tax=Bionectria ochroleuca TaxID=29856 RepID=A0A8H7NF97_BIOOC